MRTFAKVVHMKVRWLRSGNMLELLSIAAYAYQDVHVWSALLTCMRPLFRGFRIAYPKV